jgi:hypothetical protein
MLTPRAKAIRLFLTGVVLVLLVAGTFLGEDDNFPFGPFKMYAGTAHLNDPVPVMKFAGVTESGEQIDILAKQFGLRPAEIEGQLDRVANDRAVLRDIVSAYEEKNPDAEKLDVFQVKHGIYTLVDGRPVDYDEKVLAEWTRS